MASPRVEDRVVVAARRSRDPLIVAAVLTIPATVLELTHVGQPWQTAAVAVVVMSVGIGAATLVTGAVPQRFFVRELAEIEHEDADLLLQIRQISDRLRSLERAVRERRHIK